MVSARQVGSPIPDSLAARKNGGLRITPGREPVPATAGLEVLPQPLKSREASLHGVGCTVTLAPDESGPSWRCVVELPARMGAAPLIGNAGSRDEAVADAFRQAEGVLGWT